MPNITTDYFLQPNGNREFSMHFLKSVRTIIEGLGLTQKVEATLHPADNLTKVVIASRDAIALTEAIKAIKKKDLPTQPATCTALATWKETSSITRGRQNSASERPSTPGQLVLLADRRHQKAVP